MTGTEGERGTFLLMFNLSAQMAVSDQHHAPATLITENRQGTHFRGGWTCPRTGLDQYGEKKMSYYHRGSSNSGPSSALRVARPVSLYVVRYLTRFLYIYIFWDVRS